MKKLVNELELYIIRYLVKHCLQYTNHLSGLTLITIIRSCRSQTFFKISQNLLETPVLESFFNKVAGPQGCKYMKKRLQHRCFPKYCETFKNSFFYRTPLVAASG